MDHSTLVYFLNLSGKNPLLTKIGPISGNKDRDLITAHALALFPNLALALFLTLGLWDFDTLGLWLLTLSHFLAMRLRDFETLTLRHLTRKDALLSGPMMTLVYEDGSLTEGPKR